MTTCKRPIQDQTNARGHELTRAALKRGPADDEHQGA